MRGWRGAAQWSLLCSGKPISQTTHVQFRRGYDSASMATNNLPRNRYCSICVGNEADSKPFVESLSVSITHVPTTVSDCASLVSTLCFSVPSLASVCWWPQNPSCTNTNYFVTSCCSDMPMHVCVGMVSRMRYQSQSLHHCNAIRGRSELEGHLRNCESGRPITIRL
jgi:hypothetical protein